MHLSRLAQGIALGVLLAGCNATMPTQPFGTTASTVVSTPAVPSNSPQALGAPSTSLVAPQRVERTVDRSGGAGATGRSLSPDGFGFTESRLAVNPKCRAIERTDYRAGDCDGYGKTDGLALVSLYQARSDGKNISPNEVTAEGVFQGGAPVLGAMYTVRGRSEDRRSKTSIKYQCGNVKVLAKGNRDFRERIEATPRTECMIEGVYRADYTYRAKVKGDLAFEVGSINLKSGLATVYIDGNVIHQNTGSGFLMFQNSTSFRTSRVRAELKSALFSGLGIARRGVTGRVEFELPSGDTWINEAYNTSVHGDICDSDRRMLQLSNRQGQWIKVEQCLAPVAIVTSTGYRFSPKRDSRGDVESGAYRFVDAKATNAATFGVGSIQIVPGAGTLVLPDGSVQEGLFTNGRPRVQ